MKKKIIYLITTVFLVVSLVSPVAAFAGDGKISEGTTPVNNESSGVSDNETDKVTAGSGTSGQTAGKRDKGIDIRAKSNEQKTQSNEAEKSNATNSKVANNDVKRYYSKNISSADMRLSQESFYYDGVPKTPR